MLDVVVDPEDRRPAWRRALQTTWAKLVGGVGIAIAAGIVFVVNHIGNETTRPPAPAPARVAVETDVDQISFGPDDVGGEYWFPVPSSRLPRPPERRDTCAGRYAWAKSHHALDADTTRARITVSRGTTKSVAIIGFRVHVDQRREPRAGTVASCPGGGGGPSDVHTVFVDLDRVPPKLTSYPAGSQKPDPTFAFTLGDEPRVFDIVASTVRCDCKWSGRLVLSVDGKTDVVTIDDHGHPFETVAATQTNKARYVDHHWSTVSP